MSKAFTRESDDHPEPQKPQLRYCLPRGVKNYITPDGATRFQEELKSLIEVERPTLVAAQSGTALLDVRASDRAGVV